MEKNLDKLPDEELITRIREGDKNSLERIIERYRNFIYNVSLKMTGNREDAADITQEVLIKVVTKIDSFREQSSFKTWLYKISVNHILNFKKAELNRKYSFTGYGNTLDNAPDDEITASDSYYADKLVLVEETKQTCMTGMLLCLDNKHRMVFILAELFGINDKTGSQVMEISPENFRMILSRAKRDLYSFIDEKCGLINTNNPCRCAKKTKSFIKAGFVNPASRLFTSNYIQTIEQAAEEKQRNMEDLLQNEYRQLYLQHNYLEGPDFVQSLNELLSSDKLNKLFNLKQNNKL